MSHHHPGSRRHATTGEVNNNYALFHRITCHDCIMFTHLTNKSCGVVFHWFVVLRVP
jgi:hypothetical protein